MRLKVGIPQKLTGGDYQVTITVSSGTTTLSTSIDGQTAVNIEDGAFTATVTKIITFGKGVELKYEETGSSTVDIAEV